MLPLNNYDLKFMEKVEGAVGRTFVLKITSNFQGEKEEKKFRAQTPSIAGEWVREINRRIEYYHDLMMHSEDVSSTSRDVVAELEDVVVSTKVEDDVADETKVKIHHSGWLNKLGREGLKWKRRWIALRGNDKDDTCTLSWYKHTGTVNHVTHSLTYITLTNTTGLLDAPLGSVTLDRGKCRLTLLDNTKRRKWCFNVTTPERELRLKASSLQEQREWVDRIKPLISSKRHSAHCDKILTTSILRKGNMLKSGSTWSEHWKTRYFILSDGKLTWYVVFQRVPFYLENHSNTSISFVTTYETSRSPTLEQ